VSRPKSLARRRLLASLVAVALALAVPRRTRRASGDSRADLPSGVYYVEFDIRDDRERLAFYAANGLAIEKPDGGICVANPLIDGQCIVYMKPYEEDRYVLPPPGASEDFYSRCIRCGLCYIACASMGYYAIELTASGLLRLGVPTVPDVMNHPCTLCMECTLACPTGALEEVEPRQVRMGVALIDPDLCWAWNSGDCKSCAKACPFGTEVFEFTYNEWGVHTRVRPDKCTGCGQCVSACPVTGSAIHVLPLDEYERRRRSFKNTGMSYDEYLKLILETEVRDPVKATLRTLVNADYILNVRGLLEEKIVR
jgi:ferredoxin